MKRWFIGALIVSAAVLSGCAHPIVITPELGAFKRDGIVPVDKKVGYYISAADRALQVKTEGGGGDMVAYFPYKELEPALQKVLYNIFQDVKRLDSTDAGELQRQGVAYAFVPSIKTSSGSNGLLTWMPSRFTVSLNIKAVDTSGKVLWEKNIEEASHVDFAARSDNFSAAPQLATRQAFQRLQDEIVKAKELH